ncbi:amidase family protein [Hahella sp. SMD15-11]|uniref:Amidase family protein n=1 Tax=Thermohahella caldifontis TaxID=3142973 RepID=A0AB39UTR4_9GAMM
MHCTESATNLLAAMQDGRVTSETLTRQLLERIARLNPGLNAVVSQRAEAALAEARERDRERAEGRIRGPLHGLPMTVKETWDVEGEVTCAGAPSLTGNRARRHADTVQALVDAGAVILGKTNAPYMASDWQSFNRVYGTSRNPWDGARTPGGSSGGAAAALAAGLTPLELGSDIGGSIRIPAHFCGVFGHKPTRDLLSMRGHVPGPPGTVSQPDLAEGGPLARSAEDLALALQVLARPRPIDSPHWQIRLRDTLPDRPLRLGFWVADPHAPLASGLARHFEDVRKRLSAQGMECVNLADHALFRLENILPIYLAMLGSIIALSMDRADRLRLRLLEWLMHIPAFARTQAPFMEAFARGSHLSHAQWVHLHERRERLREKFHAALQDFDAVLMPVAPTVAFPHDHRPFHRRTLEIDGKPAPYFSTCLWITPATLLGLPATTVPTGFVDGLPAGMQVLAGAGRDLNTIRIAGRVHEALGSPSTLAPEKGLN